MKNLLLAFLCVILSIQPRMRSSLSLAKSAAKRLVVSSFNKPQLSETQGKINRLATKIEGLTAYPAISNLGKKLNINVSDHYNLAEAKSNLEKTATILQGKYQDENELRKFEKQRRVAFDALTDLRIPKIASCPITEDREFFVLKQAIHHLKGLNDLGKNEDSPEWVEFRKQIEKTLDNLKLNELKETINQLKEKVGNIIDSLEKDQNKDSDEIDSLKAEVGQVVDELDAQGERAELHADFRTIFEEFAQHFKTVEKAFEAIEIESQKSLALSKNFSAEKQFEFVGREEQYKFAKDTTVKALAGAIVTLAVIKLLYENAKEIKKFPITPKAHSQSASTFKKAYSKAIEFVMPPSNELLLSKLRAEYTNAKYLVEVAQASVEREQKALNDAQEPLLKRNQKFSESAVIEHKTLVEIRIAAVEASKLELIQAKKQLKKAEEKLNKEIARQEKIKAIEAKESEIKTEYTKPAEPNKKEKSKNIDPEKIKTISNLHIDETDSLFSAAVFGGLKYAKLAGCYAWDELKATPSAIKSICSWWSSKPKQQPETNKEEQKQDTSK